MAFRGGEKQMQVKGHAAIVTGGGSGLGAATARALGAAGAKVAVFDVNLEGGQKIAQEIGGLALKCDVADAASAEAAVASARAKHGPARVLVNCAGIGPAARIVGKDGPMPLAEFTRVININLIGSFNLMRLAAADMQKLDPLADGERGVIISTASVAAYEGQIGQAAYAASKGGIVALTMPAAREFARSGVRVLAIAPGLFATPMLLGMPQQVQDSLAASVPYPTRLGKPEEYAKLVMHILDNVMLNGEVIRLDGAIRMQPK
jgi:NAD(P)-dependent dehydrogenase (short-subunit alcohol dehydrogenase family)